jgi:cytochrome P450
LPRSRGRSTPTLHAQLSAGLAVVPDAPHDTPASPASQRLPSSVRAARAAVPTRGGGARAQESQRLLSVLPILFRQAQADVRIGGLLVPRGTFCIVHLVRRAPPAVLGARCAHGC